MSLIRTICLSRVSLGAKYQFARHRELCVLQVAIAVVSILIAWAAVGGTDEAQAVPPGSPAPAPWSSPITMTPAQGSALAAPTELFAQVAFAPNGNGILTAPASSSRAGTPHTEGNPILFAPIDPGDAIGSLKAFSRPPDMMQPGASLAFPGANQVAAVGTTAPGGRAWIASASIGEPLHAAHLLPISGVTTDVVVAGDVGGNVAVLARSCTKRSTRCVGRLYLLLRPAGHPFERPLLLARRTSNFPIGVAIGASKEVLAVWSATIPATHRTRMQRSEIYAQSGTFMRGVHRQQALGFAEGEGSLSLALAPSGEAIVSWATQAQSGCRSSGPAQFSAAVAAPGQRFEPVQQLDRWTDSTCNQAPHAPEIIAAIGGGGSALLAWQSYDGANLRVRSAIVSNGHVGTGNYATDAGIDATLDDLIIGPSHTGLLLWSYPGASPVLMSGIIPNGTATPATRELVTAGSIVTATIGFDPLTGRAVAAWGTDGDPPSLGYAIRAPLGTAP
jgi:hypothetical protein